MIYAFIFGTAICFGWYFSVRHLPGTSRKTWKDVLSIGNAESRTMCILTLAWMGTVIANIYVAIYGAGQASSVTVFYIFIDTFGLIWLLSHQTKNWQWMPAALFVAMLMTHAIFSFGVSSSTIANENRPYQDFLAIYGYAQIFSVIHAAIDRGRHGTSAFSRWASSDSLVLRRVLDRWYHAGLS